MKHFVREIFEKNPSQHTHDKFIKYGKGLFNGPRFKISIQKGILKVRSSYHAIDEILVFVAKHIKQSKIRITGVIRQNKDLTEELDTIGLKYLKCTKSRGVYTYHIDNDVNLKTFIAKFIQYKPYISFHVDEIKLSTKVKAPDKKKEPSTNFCFLTIPLEEGKEILKNICFDAPEKFSKAQIQHSFQINEIIYPENAESITFDEVRSLSKRKGTVIRIVEYDGTTEEKQLDFTV